MLAAIYDLSSNQCGMLPYMQHIVELKRDRCHPSLPQGRKRRVSLIDSLVRPALKANDS